MGFKTDISPIDVQLSKMEAAIETIASFATIGNLVANQLMERKAAATITAKVVSTEKPKWTTMMAKNVRQVVNRVVETLADVPKQEERKFNLHLTGFETKEGEIEKELVQWFNTELLQGQMRMRAKVITATWQWPATMASARLNTVLLKFSVNEDH
jgi:hypothetical protein